MNLEEAARWRSNPSPTMAELQKLSPDASVAWDRDVAGEGWDPMLEVSCHPWGGRIRLVAMDPRCIFPRGGDRCTCRTWDFASSRWEASPATREARDRAVLALEARGSGLEIPVDRDGIALLAPHALFAWDRLAVDWFPVWAAAAKNDGAALRITARDHECMRTAGRAGCRCMYLTGGTWEPVATSWGPRWNPMHPTPRSRRRETPR